MKHKNVHVVPSGRKWAVKPEGAASARSTHLTQRAAEEAGRKIARQNESEVGIHRPNGQIRDKDSYGKDPARRGTRNTERRIRECLMNLSENWTSLD